MILLIIEATIRSLALGLLVWLALVLARARNPHLHKTVWTTVVAASIAMPFLMSLDVAPAIPAPTYVLALQAGTGAVAKAPAHWAQGATALYALVASTLLLRFATALARTWRVRCKATVLREPWTRGDDVRISLRLRSPATFASTILLPPDFCEWSERKLAAVMAHERSHVRRKDCYILWLARLHTCLFWINPLAWWMQSRLAALAETTSDDAVVAELVDRTGYAEVLLELAATHGGTGFTTTAAQMATSQPRLAARIDRIISDTVSAAALKWPQQLLAVAILLPVVAVSAAQVATPLQAAGALAPRLIDMGGLTEMHEYYPEKAQRGGIEGIVKIAISLDADGSPTNTLILDEYPLEMGFGAAASALAHTLKFSNPARKPTQLSINVKFALQGGRPGATAPLPPPQSPAGG